MPIRVLDNHLIDQIAAGEVIERPASIVKELVENSLDAGARSIEVEIEAGGVRLTRVRDDGAAFPPTSWRWRCHATPPARSTRLDDLAAITTLGFRGEALPSIASVSRFEIVSRHAGAERAASVTVDAGHIGGLAPAAHPPGTTVEVRDLFFNLPARRKFLRSEVTEQGHIVRLVERLALSRDDVAFRLRNGSRTLLDAPALSHGSDAADGWRASSGANSSSARCEVDHSAGPVRLSGWIGTPAAARATTDLQFWFVNGRAVRDRLLMNAVRLGFRDVLYSRAPAVLRAVPRYRSRAGRRERAPAETGSALPRQPADSRLRVPRGRAALAGTRPGGSAVPPAWLGRRNAGAAGAAQCAMAQARRAPGR